MNQSPPEDEEKNAPTERILIPVSITLDHMSMMSAMLPLLNFKTTELVLLHVIEAPVTSTMDRTAFADLISDYERRLRPLADWLNQQGYRVHIKVVMARHVVDAIVEETISSSYALVFMMKRKRRSALRFFSRSITERVISRVRTPVVTVLV